MTDLAHICALDVSVLRGTRRQLQNRLDQRRQIRPGSIEASELLNASRPHLITLFGGGSLPFRMDGTLRRLRHHS